MASLPKASPPPHGERPAFYHHIYHQLSTEQQHLCSSSNVKVLQAAVTLRGDHNFFQWKDTRRERESRSETRVAIATTEQLENSRKNSKIRHDNDGPFSHMTVPVSSLKYIRSGLVITTTSTAVSQ